MEEDTLKLLVLIAMGPDRSVVLNILRLRDHDRVISWLNELIEVATELRSKIKDIEENRPANLMILGD